MTNITPFLWFNDQAEQAARFYVSLFPNSTIKNVWKNDGKVMGVNFLLHGREFRALNGGPNYPFTEAYSMFIDCDTQDEVDRLWTELTADGGSEGMCGWLKDKYGLSWQIIPTALGRLMGDTDPVKSKRVMDAMLQMKKIIISELQRAYDQA